MPAAAAVERVDMAVYTKGRTTRYSLDDRPHYKHTPQACGLFLRD